MHDNEDTRSLWDSLSDLEEAASGPLSPPPVEGLSQAPTFTDRLVQRLRDGHLPLFTFSLIAMICLGFGGHTAVLLGAPLLAWLLCLLLAPLLRLRRPFFPWLSLLIFPALALLSVVALTVPMHFDNSFFVESNTARPDFADLLQDGLESLFTSSTATILSITFLAIVACLLGFQNSHPWVRSSQVKVWRVVLALSTLFGPFLLAGYFVLASGPGEKARLWVESSQKLPTTSSGPSHADWDLLFTQHTLTELGPPAEHRASFAKLSHDLLARLGKGAPEASFDRDMTSQMIRMQLEQSESKLQVSQKADLAYFYLHARLHLRPQYQYIDAQRVLDEHILSYLPTMEAENVDLWLDRIETLISILPKSSFEEWDLNAKSYFFEEEKGEGMVFAAIRAEVPKRKVVRPTGQGFSIISKTPPRPLKFFGRSLSPSPTQVAFRWRESRALEDWARLRAYLPMMEEPETRREHIRRQADATSGSEVYEHLDQIFFEELDGRRYVDTVGPFLETARLLLRLRELKQQTGKYPTTLTGLVSEEESARWEWSRSGPSWKLVDHHLMEPQRGKPHPGWVLE